LAENEVFDEKEGENAKEFNTLYLAFISLAANENHT